jgi:hypothetical protein
VNEAELNELLSAPGFFRYLAQQAKLTAEEVKRIYLLGRPWGLWPPDLDVNREAAENGIDVYTYLAALQPLLDMDTTQKEAHLAAYEATLSGGETAQPIPAVRAYVEKVAALSGQDEATICSLLHALYAYRQRVGQLSIQKAGELSKHKIEQDKAAAIAKLQRALAAESKQRKPG